MYSENPLYLEVLGILKAAKDPVGVYELIKQLEQAGYSLDLNDNNITNASTGKVAQENVTDTNPLKLFRKNFIVMNALYQIRKDLAGTGVELHITPLSIFITAQDRSGSQALAADNDSARDEALSEFYLDWQNLQDTDQQAVDELLSSFWKRFTEYNNLFADKHKRSRALETLGVESDASWENIKTAYRSKIAIYHPDKGGTSAQFIEIREAYQILYLMECAEQ